MRLDIAVSDATYKQYVRDFATYMSYPERDATASEAFEVLRVVLETEARRMMREYGELAEALRAREVGS